jgi:hypothetical protein
MGGENLERCGQDLLPSHRRATDDSVHCWTEACGGNLWPCDPCGQEHDVYHPAYHLSPHHRNLARRLWLPGTDASVSRNPFVADPCTTTSRVPIPPQYPALHLLSHLRGAWAIRRRPHENASQAGQAGLKFQTGWRSGSVQQGCRGGCAPQQLFFVRQTGKHADHTPRSSRGLRTP